MAMGIGYETTAPLIGLNQLQQASDHRDDLRRYQNLHLTASSTESAPRAPVVQGPIAGVDTSFNGPHSAPTSGIAGHAYGASAAHHAPLGATIDSGPTQFEQYAALRNAAESAIGRFPTGGVQGSYMNGISEPGISNTGVPNLAAESKIGYSSNYTTNAPVTTGPKPNLVSRHTTSGPIGHGTTTQVKGDPRSNTITLSSRTLKGGSGCVVEAIDTYRYRRPETTNGEYGNFPQRQHEEHVLSADTALNGTLTGGPGTAEERPTLERHGNLAGEV